MADDDSIEGLFACQAENDADSAPQIISRKDAIALGFMTYFTGKPCKHGHIAERRTDNCGCEICAKINTKKHGLTEKCKLAKHAWNKNNPDKIKEQNKRARIKNPETCKQSARNWLNNNREHVRARGRNYIKTNLNKRLRTGLRTRLNVAIKRNYKAGSAVSDLGCSIEFFKEYIANQFTNGMSWNNWGKLWHLDHVKPLCQFDLTDRGQFLVVMHYTNYVPLLIADNLKKSIEDKKKSIKKRPYAPSDELLNLLEDENPAKKD